MLTQEGGRSGFSPFRRDLNQIHTVSCLKLDKEQKAQIIMGAMPYDGWVELLQFFPRRHAGRLFIMGRLLTASLQAGEWSSIPQPKIVSGIYRFSDGPSINVWLSPRDLINSVNNLVNKGYITRIKNKWGTPYLFVNEGSLDLFGNKIGYKCDH